MKKLYFFFILLNIFVLILCLSGCSKKSQSQELPVEDTPTDEGQPNNIINNENPSDNNSDRNIEDSDDKPVELLYKTTVTYNEDKGIKKFTLDTQGYPLSVFYEIPVFSEETDGYKKINAFLEECSNKFFSKENDSLNDAWEHTVTNQMENVGFYYERRAVVKDKTEQYVSVSIIYEWFMGGVNDYGSDSYSFRVDTGELIQLTDIIDSSEDEIKEMILAELEKKCAEEDSIETEYIKDYELKDFEFCIYNGKIYILFDKYEAACGAYGGFEIELPVEINLE